MLESLDSITVLSTNLMEATRMLMKVGVDNMRKRYGAATV